MKIKVECSVCRSSIEKYESQIRAEQKFFYCSKECRSISYKSRFVGENNPNFGNEWGDEARSQLGLKIKAKYEEDDQYRFKAGSANRGVKFSQVRIEKMRNAQIGAQHPPMSDETKSKVGAASKTRWSTKEFRAAQRRSREESGQWVKTSERSSYSVYKIEANWIERMIDRMSDAEVTLVGSLGMFNAKLNSKGVVRDHKLSRKSGFELGVFPEIMRHPCNCQIITHSENVKKIFSGDTIDVRQLFVLIRSYKGYWPEQEIVLQKIEEYEQGMKWNS